MCSISIERPKQEQIEFSLIWSVTALKRFDFYDCPNPSINFFGHNSGLTPKSKLPMKLYCKTQEFFNWKGTFFGTQTVKMAHLGEKPNRLQCPSLFQVLDIVRLLPHLATSWILC